MEAIKFSQANSTLLYGDIPNCDDLPVYKDGIHIISKWTMSWRERLSALFFGVGWFAVLSPNTAPAVSACVIHKRFK